MRDEFDSRLWNEHGKAFSQQIVALFEAALYGLKRLNARTWDAPWRVDDSCDRMI